MNRTLSIPTGAAMASSKKAAAAKAKKAKKPTAASIARGAEMVDAAIKALKDQGGSTLPAIKKYIAATYNVDAEKLTPLIKKHLKAGVANQKIVAGKGAFKLGDTPKKAKAKSPAKKKKASPKKKVLAVKKKAPAKTKKPKAKKSKKPAAKK